MPSKYVVASASDIPVGGHKVVTLSGRRIGVFNIAGTYYALLDRCPHQGASLCQGQLTGLTVSPEPGVFFHGREGEIIRCPWHGWQFDLKNGESWFDPAHCKVRTYPSGVETGTEVTKGPYKAETFPVSLEESYVVVEV